jgi:prepilin-type processing-associated H-X9-DG protein
MTNDVLAKVDKRHNKNANVAYVDGHVALMKGTDMSTSTFAPCLNPNEGVDDLTSLVINSGDLLHVSMEATPNWPWAGNDNICIAVNDLFGTPILFSNAIDGSWNNSNVQGHVIFVSDGSYSGSVTLQGDGSIVRKVLNTPKWWQVGPAGTGCTFQSTWTEKGLVASNILLWPPIPGLWNFTALLNTTTPGVAVGTNENFSMTIVPSGNYDMKRIALIVNCMSPIDADPTTPDPNTKFVVTGGISSVQIDSYTKTFTTAQCTVTADATMKFNRADAVGLAIPVKLGHPVIVNYFIRKENTGARGGLAWMFAE